MVEIWRREEHKAKSKKVEWELVEAKIPLRLGKPLPLIHFVFHGVRHLRANVEWIVDARGDMFGFHRPAKVREYVVHWL